MHKIQESFRPPDPRWLESLDDAAKEKVITTIATENIRYSIENILEQSTILREMRAKGQIEIVGAFYDVSTGLVEFIDPDRSPPKTARAEGLPPFLHTP